MEHIAIIQTKLPTLNEYIKVERTNRYAAATLKLKYTNTLAKELKGLELPKNTKFNITLVWYVKDNRKDHDNIAFGIKFILDGMVKAGVLKNDNPRYIGNITHQFKIDKDERVVMILEETK